MKLSEYRQWLQHPCSKEFFQFLSEEKESAENMLLNGFFVDNNSVERTALLGVKFQTTSMILDKILKYGENCEKD